MHGLRHFPVDREPAVSTLHTQSSSPLEPTPARNPALRVVLLTSPGLFGAQIINRLSAADLQLVGVGLTDRIYRNKSKLAAVHTFRVRTGWRYLAYNALQSDIAWSLLQLTRRPGGLRRSGAKVRRLEDINAAATRNWLRELQPDVIASFFFNQKIGPEVCAIAGRACINMHPSLLPELRGPDPIFRALQRGLTTTGLTLHEVSPEIDGGRILHQESRAIPEGLSAFGLYSLLIRDGADLLARWLEDKVTPQPPEPSEPGAGDYTTFPTPQEVGKFVAGGGELIRLKEWRQALREVE